MSKVLRIVLVEDTDSDVELIRAELRLRGCEAQLRVVAGEADFRAALCEAPDLVLSDYRLPGFGGMRALELLRERDATIPFSKPRPIEELEPILLRDGHSNGNPRMPRASAG